MDYLRKEGNVAVAVTGREQEFADAKIAALHYRILEEINAPSPLALADVTIGTGRFHQIRVQFASRKHPLYGDGKYGSRFKGDIALQSAGLQFVHPETGEKMAFQLEKPLKAPWELTPSVTCGDSSPRSGALGITGNL